jgi:hypothetical protein
MDRTIYLYSVHVQTAIGFCSVDSQALQIPHDQSGNDVLIIRFVDFLPRLCGQAIAL